MNRRKLAIGGALVAALLVLVLLLPTVDLANTSLSAYGSESDDVSIATNSLRQSGYQVSSLTLGPTALNGVNPDRVDALYLSFGVERGYTGAELDALFSFVEQGGTAVVLDDTGASESLLDRLDVDKESGLLSTRGDPSNVRVVVNDSQVNLWEPVELEPGEDADVSVIATAGNGTVKDVNGDGEISESEPTCGSGDGCPVALRADRGQGRLYVIGDVTFATNDRAEGSGIIQVLGSIAQRHGTGQQATVIVDESRHVAGAAEVGLTVFRTLLVPTGFTNVAYAISGLVLVAAAYSARDRGTQSWPEHDPGLDEPYRAAGDGEADTP